MGRVQIVSHFVAAQADKILILHLGGQPADQIVLVELVEAGLELFQQAIQLSQPGIQIHLILVVGSLYRHGFATPAGLHGPIIFATTQVVKPLTETAEVLRQFQPTHVLQVAAGMQV